MGGLDDKDLAYRDYQNGMKYKEIAEKYGVSLNTVKSWKQRNNWERSEPKGCTQNIKKGAHKVEKYAHKDAEKGANKKKGAQPGNHNATGNKGGAAPEGNVNAVKHGAYQTIYASFLPDEEKELYEQMSGDTNLEEEIRLLRLKLTRLLSRERDFFYDGFGVKHEKTLSEEDREVGILACMKQLEKLVKTQEQMKRSTLDEEEQKARIDKLRAETARITENEDDVELVDDGFLTALSGKVAEVWEENE